MATLRRVQGETLPLARRSPLADDRPDDGGNEVREDSRSSVLAIVAKESAEVQVLRTLSASGQRIARVYAQAPSAEMRGVTVGRLAESLGLPQEDAVRVRDPAVADELWS